ncbi:MAG: DUF6452 family protein [Paludibacteraceae bacterium]
MKHCIQIFLLVSVVVACVSCNGDDTVCRKEKTVVVGVALYRTTYNATTETFTTVSASEKLTVWGIGNDSALYTGSAVSSLELPLHTQVDTTAFVLQRDSMGRDTLTIYHRNDTNFISLECGCFVYHTIDAVSVTPHQIDSVIIEKTAVQNISENHLRIYYR